MTQPPKNRRRPRMHPGRGFAPRGVTLRGFTLVELLVVVVIIIALLAAVLVASSAVLGSARATGTRAMLQVVQEAVEEFRREQEARPSIARGLIQAGPPVRRYRDRYGLYPPDELEVFADGPAMRPAPQSLAPGRAQIMPDPIDYGPLRYYPQADPADQAKEFRDQVAMQIAIKTFGQASAAALDRLPDKNRKSVPRDAGGDPLVYLDRGIPAAGTAPDGAFSESGIDLEVTYIVDDWGNPISYMSQRDWTEGNSLVSSNHPEWNEASTELIRLNKGLPLIFSYGADGAEQMTAEYMGTSAGEPAAVSLVGDFEEATDGNHRIDDPLNADNVYVDPDLTRILLEGIPE